MPSLLFVCVANSCRSQMAETIAKASRRPGWEIWSAGSHPSGQIHPLARQLAAELGFELSGQWSKGLAELPPRRWDYVVTMGCGDRCPTVSAHQRLAWDIPDPVSMPIEEARKVRDQMAILIGALLSGQATASLEQHQQEGT